MHNYRKRAADPNPFYYDNQPPHSPQYRKKRSAAAEFDSPPYVSY